MNIEKYILVVNKGNMIEASKAKRHERATEEERHYIYIFDGEASEQAIRTLYN